MEMKAEYLAIFSEEADDQLRQWEESLLALEKAPADREPLNNLFRAIHTLKGSAGFIGFDLLQKLAHDLESSLSAVRDAERPYDGILSDLLFQALDLARSLIEAFRAGRSAADAAGAVDDLLSRLEVAATPKAQKAGTAAELHRGSQTVTGSTGPAPSSVPAVPGVPTQTSRLVVRIEGERREAFLRSRLVKARLDRMGTVQAVEPDPETLRDATDPFVYTVTITAGIDAAEIASSISIDQVSVAPEDAAVAQPALQTASPLPTPAAAAPPAAAAGGAAPGGSRPEEVVRVSVQKLDTLLNLVGELVIHNAGFIATTQVLEERYGRTKDIFALEEKTEALSAITRDLQDGIMKARMLPIASVFSRFRRVVRDLAKASGKSVVLEVFGEETEIDKKVIDRIGEPLVHLVRNAVDHGLETAEERRRAGKPESGTIRLGAYQEGDHICVEVTDDGRGLDRKGILAKALEKGLLSKDEAPKASPEQVLGFIFIPGFSTARVVTDVSGRGVGMDAVRRAVDEMNGTLRVRSTPGAGTTVSITLPLTMAIIGAVVVEAAGSTYAIPMSAVREIVKATEPMLKTVGTRRTLLLRNEVLALVNLAQAMKDGGNCHGATRSSAETPAESRRIARSVRPVVVVDYEGSRIGLEADRVLGSREVVIKSLSRHYREVDGLIGASILGDGRIALIVDVESMIHQHSPGPRGTGVHDAPLVRETAHPAAAEAPRAIPPAPDVQAALAASPAEPEVTTPQAPIEQLARDVSGPRGRLLQEVNNQGAIQASLSLSQLTGQEIRVSFPESRLVPIKEVAGIMGGEERTVGGIYVDVRGDLDAGMLLVIPAKNLLVLDDLLHGRHAGTSKDLAGVDLSGVSEIGNLLAACFLNAMADASHLSLTPEVPEISVDMCLSVIDSVLARFNQPGDRLLLTDAVIYGEGWENVVCHQVLFLEPDSMRRLMEALVAAASRQVTTALPGAV
jgi:two-component system chemotaxis sensor kinase CheA